MGKPDHETNLYVFVKERATSFILYSISICCFVFFWLLSGLNFFWLLQQLADGERLIMAHQLLFNGPLLTFFSSSSRAFDNDATDCGGTPDGNSEAVLTTPISETQFVLVKFVSAFIFYLILWLPALIYCGVLHSLCLTQGVVFLKQGYSWLPLQALFSLAYFIMQLAC